MPSRAIGLGFTYGQPTLTTLSSAYAIAFLESFFGLASLRLDMGAKVLGIVLAVIAGSSIRSWEALDNAARDATITYVLTLGTLSLLVREDLQIPTPLSLAFWLMLVLVFVFYELAIAAIFAIRRLLIRCVGHL